jgi:hypothetical protein
MYHVTQLTLMLATEVKKDGNMLLTIITRLPASHIIRRFFSCMAEFRVQYS